jgi:octaprenyl-diphosphate synthase
MDFQELRDLVAADMQAVDQYIHEKLYSEVVLIGQMSNYIVNSGGKRLRPVLLLLSARACGYEGQDHIRLAAIIEFIHTATLLHDDVVDDSKLRRGQETANQVWGNEASVLVGDFLYSRAFQMMVEISNMRVMDILSETTNTIAEGEVMQLVNCQNPDTSEQQYMDIIHNKTAKLFEAASRLGAVIYNTDAAQEQALADYGMHLGTAFQIIDDVLDYSASADELGKNIGDDLAEGKPTLPLLYAMWNSGKEDAARIRYAIEHGDTEHIAEISGIIESTGAIKYTAALARQEAELAISRLDLLQASPYREALKALAEFSVSRGS